MFTDRGVVGNGVYTRHVDRGLECRIIYTFLIHPKKYAIGIPVLLVVSWVCRNPYSGILQDTGVEINYLHFFLK